MFKEKILALLFFLLLAIGIFVICKRCRAKIIAILVSMMIIVGGIAFFLIFWGNPVKYALEEAEFNNYSDYILVKETHYTGTGWTIVGDENGYFSDSSIEDIVLEGEKLPEANTPAERYNTFLCIVEYRGEIEHIAYEEKLNCYVVKDWYPVYPIVRNRLFPQKFYPQRYMTDKDIKGY